MIARARQQIQSATALQQAREHGDIGLYARMFLRDDVTEAGHLSGLPGQDLQQLFQSTQRL